MMSDHVQPDLFGEYDARQAQARLWDQPHTCPRCGSHEPNGSLLRSNHGIEPGEDTIGGFTRGAHPNFGELCMAQWLVRNHIIFAVQRADADQLARDSARGRELGLDVEAIIEAERVTTPPEKPLTRLD